MLHHLRQSLGGAPRFAEFLPDAEGVVERGHSPVAVLLILSISVVVAGMLAWAALTEVEQVGQADAGGVGVGHATSGACSVPHVAHFSITPPSRLAATLVTRASSNAGIAVVVISRRSARSPRTSARRRSGAPGSSCSRRVRPDFVHRMPPGETGVRSGIGEPRT